MSVTTSPDTLPHTKCTALAVPCVGRHVVRAWRRRPARGRVGRCANGGGGTGPAAVRIPPARRRGVPPAGRQAPHGGAVRRPPRSLVSQTSSSTSGTTPARVTPVAATVYDGPSIVTSPARPLRVPCGTALQHPVSRVCSARSKVRVDVARGAAGRSARDGITPPTGRRRSGRWRCRRCRPTRTPRRRRADSCGRTRAGRGKRAVRGAHRRCCPRCRRSSGSRSP